MPKLTIVVGLPGAGKSTYCGHHAPGGLSYGDVCHPSRTSGPKGLGDVVVRLREGNDCLIEDVSFCEAAQRERVETWIRSKVPSLQIEWIYFENSVRKCFSNIVDDYLKDQENENPQQRDHSSRFVCFFDMVKRKKYTIPQGVEVRPVVSEYELKAGEKTS